MATTSTPTTPTTGSTTPVQDIVKNNVTYVVVREVEHNKPLKDEKGNPITKDENGVQVAVLGDVFGDWKSVPESEDVDKEIAAGNLEEKGRQTFVIPDVNTIQGCRDLVTDDEEFVNIFSAGLNQKMKNRARTAPLTKDFEFKSGVIDLTELANQKSERQRLSPAEKLARSLEQMFPGLSPEQRAALVAQAQQLAAQ